MTYTTAADDRTQNVLLNVAVDGYPNKKQTNFLYPSMICEANYQILLQVVMLQVFDYPTFEKRRKKIVTTQIENFHGC